MTPEQLTSQYHDFKIDLISLDEPNYGRMLWKVKLIYKGQDLTQTILKDWDYIYNISEDKYNMDSFDKKAIYIPAENPLIFYPDNFKIHKILAVPNPFERYIGNIYGESRLIELYSKSIVVTNLLTLKSKIIQVDSDRRIEWAKITRDNKIEISFREVEIKGLIEITKARGEEIIADDSY